MPYNTFIVINTMLLCFPELAILLGLADHHSLCSFLLLFHSLKTGLQKISFMVLIFLLIFKKSFDMTHTLRFGMCAQITMQLCTSQSRACIWSFHIMYSFHFSFQNCIKSNGIISFIILMSTLNIPCTSWSSFHSCSISLWVWDMLGDISSHTFLSLS